MSVVLPPPDGDDTMKRSPRGAPLIRRSEPVPGSSPSPISSRARRARAEGPCAFDPSVLSSRRISCERNSSFFPTGASISRSSRELGEVSRRAAAAPRRRRSGRRRSRPPARGGPESSGRSGNEGRHPVAQVRRERGATISSRRAASSARLALERSIRRPSSAADLAALRSPASRRARAAASAAIRSTAAISSGRELRRRRSRPRRRPESRGGRALRDCPPIVEPLRERRGSRSTTDASRALRPPRRRAAARRPSRRRRSATSTLPAGQPSARTPSG